jgi:hypothetical protein
MVCRRQCPGETPRIHAYVSGVAAYKKKCDEIAAGGYEGFRRAASVEQQRFAAD